MISNPISSKIHFTVTVNDPHLYVKNQEAVEDALWSDRVAELKVIGVRVVNCERKRPRERCRRTSATEARHGGAAVGEDNVVDDDGEGDHL